MSDPNQTVDEPGREPVPSVSVPSMPSHIGRYRIERVLEGKGHEGPLPTTLMMSKQLHVNCVMVGSRKAQRDMVRAVEVNNIRPVIDSTWPLSALADAFRHQESSRHFGKIAINL